MNIVKFSVHRPVFVSMMSCIVIILGGISLKFLPIDLMPEITYPSVTVRTTYDDAGPEEVEELISRPLEQALSAVSGVKEITSVSSEENSNVQISFNWGVDFDDAVADVRDRIDRAMRRLPDDIERPTIMRFNSSNMPIMRLSVGTSMDLLSARKFLDDQVIYRLERINGVASCDVWGGYTREIQVKFDLDKARTLNTKLDSIISKINAGNVTSPAGNMREGRLEVRVRTPWKYQDLEELRSLVIATGENNEPIYLRDVAEVHDTIEKVSRYVRVNGQDGIQMAVYKQSSTNTVAVAEAVKAELEKINRDFPQLKIMPMIDNSEFIRIALNTVADSAISGGILAILVLLFFLRNMRSTLIIALSIPMSIIATFVLIYFCGFTLNIMTLGGLALGIGMLVDNSIVVLENITRLRDSGLSRKEAAEKGANEVAVAIFASTMTTFAVFLPLLFIQGLAGIMFREFSSVVVFSLGCSLITALSLVPMLAGKFINPSTHHKTSEHGAFNKVLAVSDVSVTWLENLYEATLITAIKHRWKIIIISVLLTAASCLLVPLIGKELMPKTDEGVVNVNIECEVGTSPEVVLDFIKKLEPQIAEVCGKDIRGYVAQAGGSSWRGNGGHNGSFSIRLVNKVERERSSEEIANLIAQKIGGTPGIKVRARSSQAMMVMGSSSGSEAVNIDVRGFDQNVALSLANQLIAIAENTPGVTDAKLSRDLGTPEMEIKIDRFKAADLGISVQHAANSLRTILAGTSAGVFRESGEEYTILVKVKDADYLSMDELLDISIPNEQGELIALSNILSFEKDSGAVAIERKNQERVLGVSANIFNRDMGAVISDITEAKNQIALPSGFAILFTGDYEELVKSFQELIFAFLLAIALVYMVMACQFESFLDPLIVMFSVPLACIGVFLALFLTNSTFNIQSFIGCIMLAGVVVNNAILLIDTANTLSRTDKMEFKSAVVLAGKRRLRPILMTSLTTILGLLPLALGLGDGSESQAPMARVVIGGLISSTFITLILIPIIYYSFFKKKYGTTE